MEEKKVKKVRLVSVSFSDRDLNPGLVVLKGFALKNKEIAENYSINISQYLLDTPDNSIVEELNKLNEDLYGFSCFVWNIKKFLDIAKKLKKSNPKTRIFMGGPEASGMAETLLRENEFIDFVFVGEAELGFTALLSGKELSEVPNLVYRAGEKIVKNEEKFLQNLDELVLPYELKDYKDYLDNSPNAVKAAVETSRGCPFQCGYCNWGGTSMRYISLTKLKPAFEYLFNHPKVKTIYITDSNPFLKKDRACELLSFLVEKNKFKKPVTLELNPEHMSDEKLLELVVKLNNEEFAFGLQSISKKVLEKIGRPFDAKKYAQNVNLMKKLNPKISTWFSLIIGLPDDNLDQYMDSLNFILQLNPDGIYAHELLCLPGSAFYKNPEFYGIEFQREAPHKILANNTFPRQDYDRAKWLSYNIALLQRIPSLSEKLFKLWKTRNNGRLVDLYAEFIEFFSRELDTLSDREISEVSSWFFEEFMDRFLKDSKKIKLLKSMYDEFEQTQFRGERNAESS